MIRRLLRRRPLLPRRARIALVLLCAAGAIATAAASSAQEPLDRETGPEPDAGGERAGSPGIDAEGVTRSRLEEEGRQLFVDGCSSCHGMAARGIGDRAPSLHGVGELAADFYLRTGRMPLDDPEDQPRRSESPYTERQIDALIAYVGSLGGPPVPEVDPARGDLAEGLRLFGDNCAGCHQIAGQGGITTRAWVPDLQVAEPVDVAEAIEIGPYVMPSFAERFSQHEIDSLARYVEYTEDPEDRGGWGIGHIGPVPEGMVTWLLAIVALLFTIRLIGERTTDEI